MKVSFFGNFGQGNLGNEATLQAIIYNLRQHLQDVEMTCICTGPEVATKIHNIPAVPMKPIFIKQRPGQYSPMARFLWMLFIGIPRELCRWYRAFIILRGTDMLIVPGTQFLSDNLTGPSWPYRAFQWSVVSKLCGCKLLFVSVGVGPLGHPLSRFFVKFAFLIADYCSYRDECSRQYMRRIGFDSSMDPVFPDLAFSLSMPAVESNMQRDKERPVIALGVLDYHGQFGPHSVSDSANIVYAKYLDNISTFASWLLEHMYTVRLVIGDVSYDAQVLADLRKSLNQKDVQYDKHQLIDEPIESMEQLISHLAKSDIVVSPRFHNVVLGLLLNRPVIALSYHEKFSALMEEPDLAKYNLHIDHLDANALVGRFIELEKNAEKLRPLIKQKVEEYRTALDEQYRYIFGGLLCK